MSQPNAYNPFVEKPANFGHVYDDPYSTVHDADTKFDHATTYTHYTTGVVTTDTSNYLNERGETRAQEVANSYRLYDGKQDSESHKPGFVDRASHVTDLTYFDEHFNHYSSRQASGNDDAHDASLMANQQRAPRSDTPRPLAEMEYRDPYVQNRNGGKLLSFFTGDGSRFPLEQRIENKKRGIGRQKHAFVVWVLTAGMVGVYVTFNLFIYELVRNWQEQGTPVSFKPVVNPMLGPSQTAIINFGARFPPCMKTIADISSTQPLFACLNDTANPPTSLCSLETICGFGGFNGKPPDQWWRFITPIFIHVGIIHILLNLLAQLTLSAQIEREMGSGGFFLLYFSAGIFGNVLGANFALIGAPSAGASGAIFGTIAVLWVDLFAHWQFKRSPKKELLFLVIDLVIGVGLGYIPGVDNFAHLGGFFMGLIAAVIFLPVVSVTKTHRLIFWCLRLAAIPVAVVMFVLLIRNFYTGDPYSACTGCRYLSCWPTAANNHCQGTGLSFTTN